MRMKNKNKRHAPQPIGSIINKVLESWKKNIDTKEMSMLLLWKKIVGERIAKHSRLEKIIGRKLRVFVESSSWMNELTFLKNDIKIKAKNLFSEYGIEIEDIIFRLGT